MGHFYTFFSRFFFENLENFSGANQADRAATSAGNLMARGAPFVHSTPWAPQAPVWGGSWPVPKAPVRFILWAATGTHWGLSRLFRGLFHSGLKKSRRVYATSCFVYIAFLPRPIAPVNDLNARVSASLEILDISSGNSRRILKYAGQWGFTVDNGTFIKRY